MRILPMVASLYPKEVPGRRFQKGDLADWTNTASFLFVETEGMAGPRRIHGRNRASNQSGSGIPEKFRLRGKHPHRLGPGGYMGETGRRTNLAPVSLKRSFRLRCPLRVNYAPIFTLFSIPLFSFLGMSETAEEWMNPTPGGEGRADPFGHKVEEANGSGGGGDGAGRAGGHSDDGRDAPDQEEVTAVEPDAEVHEVVADKGYHSNETVLELKALGLGAICRKRIGGTELEGERNTKRRCTRIGGATAGATVPRWWRPFAPVRDRGVASDFVRGHANGADPCLNLGLLMRSATPRSRRAWTRLFTVIWAPMGHWIARNHPGVVPARFAVLRSWNPSLGHLNGVRKEHKPEKSRFCPGCYQGGISVTGTLR